MTDDDAVVGWRKRREILSQISILQNIAELFKAGMLTQLGIVTLIFVNYVYKHDAVTCFMLVVALLYLHIANPRPASVAWKIIALGAGLSVLANYFIQIPIFCACTEAPEHGV